MKAYIAFPSLLIAVCCAVGFAQTDASPASFLHNDRLKLLSLPDAPIIGDSRNRVVQGVWIPESSASDKALAFPMQVHISCHNYGPEDRTCVEPLRYIGPRQKHGRYPRA